MDPVSPGQKRPWRRDRRQAKFRESPESYVTLSIAKEKLCKCVHVRVCVHTRACMGVHACVHMCMSVYVCRYERSWVYIPPCMAVHACVHVCAYLCTEGAAKIHSNICLFGWRLRGGRCERARVLGSASTETQKVRWARITRLCRPGSERRRLSFCSRKLIPLDNMNTETKHAKKDCFS